MKVEQIYTGCLSEATYFIKSGNEGAIVDPLRETGIYLDKIASENVTLKYIFITHFHADFVSGHVDLADKTGAKIIFGPNATAEFKFYLAKDEEIFTLGDVKIKTIHTPGHTLESTCYLLYNQNQEEHCLFTGDTLFIDGCGRVDLPGSNSEDMFRSLQKLAELPDETILLPGHNYSARGHATMAETKKTNAYMRINNLDSWKMMMGG